VSLHAVNAAEAAAAAQQAAVVAKRVAAHTDQVAHDTAAALRYTQNALRRANANADEVAEVGKQAEKLEEESGAGSTSGSAESESETATDKYGRNGDRGSRGSSDNHGEAAGTSRRGEKYSSSRLETDSSGTISRDGIEREPSEGIGEGAGSDRWSTDHLDVNSEIVPYPSGVEPFGQEEPARELTKDSVKQSDGMVKQIEHAQGTEAKRSVYRALTKLRGATIASYDGIAKGHLKNVDNYNKQHKWRLEHPMRHLAEEEADTHIWAFPKKASKTIKSSTKLAPKAPAGVSKTAAAPAPATAA
jgi:hypothetical protein